MRSKDWTGTKLGLKQDVFRTELSHRYCATIESPTALTLNTQRFGMHRAKEGKWRREDGVADETLSKLHQNKLWK